MTQILPALVLLVPALYLLAWVNYALLFFTDHPLVRKTATPFLLGVLGLHFLTLLGQAGTMRRCPMGNLPEVLSVIVLSVVAVYLVLEHRQNNRYTGVFLLALVVPVAVVSFSAAPAGAVSTNVSKLLKSPLFSLHTSLALLGYAALTVCAVYGFMFLLLHRALKRQTFGLVFQRLPSLDGLAAMTVHAAVIGFAALTLTIVVGMLWGMRAIRGDLLQVSGGLWSDPKIALTVLVWAVYGVAILARFFLKWSNRRVVLLFLAGFVMAVLAVVVLNTWLHTFHRFTT